MTYWELREIFGVTGEKLRVKCEILGVRSEK